MAVVVVVTAMLVVVMVATMVVAMMISVVMVAMIVATMPMCGMIVTRMFLRFVRVAVCGVGTTFRIERRFDLDHPRAQPLHHVFDDVIAANTQSFSRDLRRQMPVAEMPGDANKMLRIVAADFQKRLCCCHNFDQPTVLQHQRVAATQRDCSFEIQQEFKPARSCHRHPSPVAIVEVEHNRIRWRLAPAMSAANLRGADHTQSFSTFASLMISITVGAARYGAAYSRQTFMCGALPWALRSSRVSQRSTTT
jgi:hypothetical protein